jgi:hypothetical protein
MEQELGELLLKKVGNSFGSTKLLAHYTTPTAIERFR